MATQILLPTENLQLRESTSNSRNLNNGVPNVMAKHYQSNANIPFKVNPDNTLIKNAGSIVEIIDNYYTKKYKDEQDVLFAKSLNEFRERDREDLKAYSQLKGQDAIDGWEDYLKQRDLRRKEYESVWSAHPHRQAEWVQNIEEIQGRNKLNALDYKINQTDKIHEDQLQTGLSNSLVELEANLNSPRYQYYLADFDKAYDEMCEYAGIRPQLEDGSVNPVYDLKKRQLFDQTMLHSVDYFTDLDQYSVANRVLDQNKDRMTQVAYQKAKAEVAKKAKRYAEHEMIKRSAGQRADVSKSSSAGAGQKYNAEEAAVFIDSYANRELANWAVANGFATVKKVKNENGQEVEAVVEIDNLTQDDRLKLANKRDELRADAEALVIDHNNLVDSFRSGQAMALDLAVKRINQRELQSGKKLSIEEREDPLSTLSYEDRGRVLMAFDNDYNKANAAFRKFIDLKSKDRINYKNNDLHKWLTEKQIYTYFKDPAGIAQFETMYGGIPADELAVLKDMATKAEQKVLQGKNLDENSQYNLIFKEVLSKVGITTTDITKLNEDQMIMFALAKDLTNEFFDSFVPVLPKDNGSKGYTGNAKADLTMPTQSNAITFTQLSYTKRYQDLVAFYDELKTTVKDVYSDVEDSIKGEEYEDEVKADIRLLAIKYFDREKKVPSKKTLEQLFMQYENDKVPTDRRFKSDVNSLKDFYDNKFNASTIRKVVDFNASSVTDRRFSRKPIVYFTSFSFKNEDK